MPEIPEKARDAFPADELVRRMRQLRELHQSGAISAVDFNAFASAFQFTDDIGHLWTVGANSDQWYRWDRTEWTAAQPPTSLWVANADLQASSEWIITAGGAASRPASAAGGVPGACAGCGSQLPAGTKLC